MNYIRVNIHLIKPHLIIEVLLSLFDCQYIDSAHEMFLSIFSR